MRDRFELLSAYLDGEVTAAERRQVEYWLEHDPSAQSLYHRLLRLRQGMRGLWVPEVEQQPVEQTVQQVMTRLERKPKRAFAWGGAAIAAMFLAAMSPILFADSQSPGQQLAKNPGGTELPDEGLMIALDRPVVDIPEVANQPASSSQKNFTKINEILR